jgi:histidinol-phosphate aminotransferase
MSVSFLENLEKIEPYIGGMPIQELSRKIGVPKDQIIKLASNENPYGFSKKVHKAIIEYKEYFLYPDGSGYELINKISEVFNLQPNQIVLGNGSNDVLELCARVVANHESEIIFSEHAFAVYGLVTKAVGAKEIIIPALDFQHHLDGFFNAITKKTKLIFIANPNNPTGTLIKQQSLYEFIQKVPSNILVVIDEAYEEYLEAHSKSKAFLWLEEFENVIVSRSFSKAYGLAALRVGFGVGSSKTISKINQIRQPFNVNSLAQIAAIESLTDLEFVAESVHKNNEQKKTLEQSFNNLNLSFIKSYGNFVSFSLGSPSTARRCYEYLLNKGIILRPISNYGMPEFLRVSIGTKKENKIFIEKLTEFIGNTK